MDVDSDSESESSSSDEDEVVNPKFDQEFFKTLATLKSKDPSIYDKNTRFFDGVEGPISFTNESDANGEIQQDVSKKQKKSKPVTLKDYERKIILERGGKFDDGNVFRVLFSISFYIKC